MTGWITQFEPDAYGVLGLLPHEFYEFTLREFTRMVNGYQDRREAETIQLKWAVWHSAVLSRVRKMPPFCQFVGKTPRTTKFVSAEDQAAQLRDLKELLSPATEEGRGEGDVTGSGTR